MSERTADAAPKPSRADSRPSLRERFDAMRNIPPFLRLIWQTSRPLTLASIGLLAVALGLYLGRVLNDVVLGFLAAGSVLFAVTALFYLLWRWVLRDRIILAVINAAHAKPEHLP
ncbi:MAG TPA: hypothetical protein PLN54_12820 [Flavobacteriales bacterium]|nr:hypothetical protein [Flavobacteriales bacterium]